MTKSRQVITEDDIDKAGATKAPVPTPIDLKMLLSKTHRILEREIAQLNLDSATGLLDRDASLALVNYVKLLKELIKDENSLVENMTDAELEQAIKGKD